MNKLRTMVKRRKMRTMRRKKMKTKLLLPRRKQQLSPRKEHQANQGVMTMAVKTKCPVTVEAATMSLMNLLKLTKGRVGVLLPKRSMAVMMKAVGRSGVEPKRVRVKVAGRRKVLIAMTVITRNPRRRESQLQELRMATQPLLNSLLSLQTLLEERRCQDMRWSRGCGLI